MGEAVREEAAGFFLFFLVLTNPTHYACVLLCAVYDCPLVENGWVSAKYTQGITISLLKFIKSKTTLRRTRKETRERGTVRAEARD